jgi:hypothetical protein
VIHRDPQVLADVLSLEKYIVQVRGWQCRAPRRVRRHKAVAWGRRS